MFHIKFVRAVSFDFSDSKSSGSKPRKVQQAENSASFSILRLSSPPDHSFNCHTIVTIANDLGEQFFYGDIQIKATLWITLDSELTQIPGQTIVDRAFIPKNDGSKYLPSLLILAESATNWTRGLRSVPISVSVPVSHLKQTIANLKKKLASRPGASKAAPSSEIYAFLRLEPVGTPVDAMNMDLTDTMDELYQDCQNHLTSEPDLLLTSTEIGFLPTCSCPLRIIDQDKYQVDASMTSSRYCLREFLLPYCEEPVTILEELGNGIERHLWNAGIHTIEKLTELLKCFLPGSPQKVLELGTGVGVVSIALSKIFVENVKIIATDLPEARLICELNFQLNKCPKTIEFHDLEWCTDEKSGFGVWELIIITDCTYNPSYYDDLIHVVQREASEDTRIIIAHKVREATGEMEFFEKFEHHFNTVGTCWIHNLHESVYIGCYKKK